jgi:hypothetical protein
VGSTTIATTMKAIGKHTAMTIYSHRTRSVNSLDLAVTTISVQHEFGRGNT